MRRLAFLIGILVVVFILTSSAPSQDKKPPEKKKEAPPKLLYAMPLVAKPGEKQKLALRGKNLAAVKEVKVAGIESAKLKLIGGKAAGVPNNFPIERVGDSEVEIELDLPKGAKPGAVTLTAVGPGGDSNAYALLIRDDTPAVAEKEPNDGFDQAQSIAVPAAVEATIKGERDPDVFKFEGKKGDKVRVEVQAARFGSPTDAFLTVSDSARRVIDSADDTDGSSDPRLTVTLPADGSYFIAVIDANDLGGPHFGYRLVVKSAK